VKVVTGEQMRDLDRRTVSEGALPSILLMENAGLKVAEAVTGLDVRGRKVLVVSGRGNNGGDGFVAARHLLGSGYDPTVVLCARASEVGGDARVNLDALGPQGIEVVEAPEDAGPTVEARASRADIVVDALLGTGIRGGARGPAADAIEAVNRAGRPVVAVDVPSGLDSDSGAVEGPCVEADVTVTMGLPKVGLLLYPGAAYAGRVVVADICIPRELVRRLETGLELLDTELVSAWLPRRRPDAHKGVYGRVLVVAGSVGMTGAAVLASEAALRSGAGLVTLAVPRALNEVAEVKLTEVMSFPLPGPEGYLGPEASDAILELSRRCEVVALGPGLGSDPSTKEAVRALVPRLEVPLVLDADGINALEGEPAILRSRRAATVITPHPGELSRLTGVDVRDIQEDRVAAAREASAVTGAVVLLKGARSIIAGDGGKAYINPTGNEGMASGGTGDVLTGVVAGLVSQGATACRAAAAGSYVHGTAGDVAAERYGSRYASAGDVLRHLADAFQRLDRSRADE